MANKEDFLDSLSPGVSLPVEETMLKIYGYEISNPGFAETALQRLESLGCSAARDAYERAVDEYKERQAMAEKSAGHWWNQQLERREEIQKRKDGTRSRKVQNMTKAQLIALSKEFLEQGIAADPAEAADLIMQLQ